MLDEIAATLTGSKALVLTGAGMSTDTGIPDYRGPDGQRRVTPMQHSEFVSSTEARRRYWARSYVGWQHLRLTQPNAAHLAVTRLQRAGHLGHVITQNVDGLHQRAGTDDVVELHGSLGRVICLQCNAAFTRLEVDAQMRADNPDFADANKSSDIRPDGDVGLNQIQTESFRVPLCAACGADLLKPDVVFFGDSVPAARVDLCSALTDVADALVVLGSSLAVMSGLRFVRRAAARATPIVIITRGTTRADDLASHRVDADLASTLQEVGARLA